MNPVPYSHRVPETGRAQSRLDRSFVDMPDPAYYESIFDLAITWHTVSCSCEVPASS